jgi:hypothetical protein
LRTHFWSFTEVLQEIRSDITRKVWIFLEANGLLAFTKVRAGKQGMSRTRF